MLFCTNSTVNSQSKALIGLDIRGRVCNGGRDLCSANKISQPDNNISSEKTGQSSFVLTIVRNSITAVSL